MAGATGLCLFQLLLAPVRYYPLALFLLGCAGWSMITLNASSNTTIQMAVPHRLRGRVMSVYSLVFIGLMPLGNLFSGSVSHMWGAPVGFALGAGLGLVFLALWGSRPVRRGPEVEAVSEDQSGRA